MMDNDTVSRGYSLLYQLEHSAISRKRRIRYFRRDYRRGGYVARNYLVPLISNRPLDILEVGASNGYFSQGVKYNFPTSRITYIDIVEDFAVYYKDHFDCTAVTGEFGADKFRKHKFDLVIARDLLEHVRDPYQFLKDASAVLREGGFIHFITPNGRENLWITNQLHIHQGRESLLRINHVHYFLPETLDRLLQSSGFEKRIYFKYGLKHHKRGIGHKKFTDFQQQELPDIDYSNKVELSSVLWKHDRQEVTKALLYNMGFLSRLYSIKRDRPWGRVGYYDPKGSEFLVVAQKVNST
jgi:2-polyprenyl-3-methyl-5-hydroxy-6-metoxy-1,4-benzoquinol methylase